MVMHLVSLHESSQSVHLNEPYPSQNHYHDRSGVLYTVQTFQARVTWSVLSARNLLFCNHIFGSYQQGLLGRYGDPGFHNAWYDGMVLTHSSVACTFLVLELSIFLSLVKESFQYVTPNKRYTKSSALNTDKGCDFLCPLS